MVWLRLDSTAQSNIRAAVLGDKSLPSLLSAGSRTVGRPFLFASAPASATVLQASATLLQTSSVKITPRFGLWAPLELLGLLSSSVSLWAPLELLRLLGLMSSSMSTP